jgi:hypothetical protein
METPQIAPKRSCQSVPSTVRKPQGYEPTCLHPVEGHDRSCSQGVIGSISSTLLTIEGQVDMCS